MSSKFIAQMSSYHCRHRQNWTNVLQTLPPMANVLQPFIVQMSSYHCRHCQNWADVLQTLPPKQMSSNYYQPLLPELVKCKIWSPMMALPIFSHYYLGRPVHKGNFPLVFTMYPKKCPQNWVKSHLLTILWWLYPKSDSKLEKLGQFWHRKLSATLK